MAEKLYPTAHAVEKMNARAVTWGQIVDTVNNPEVVYRNRDSRKVCQRGPLSVVVAEDGAVVTVLLRSEEQWDDEQARGRGVNNG